MKRTSSFMRIGGLAIAASCVAMIATIAAFPATASGQQAAPQGDASSVPLADRPLATRAELESQLQSLEDRLAGATGDRSLALAERADKIRRRLREGDFRPGDLVDLRVRGHPDMTDTFTVNQARGLDLTKLPQVSLGGVLYSEVEGVLQEALAQYIRDPHVEARPLLRVAVVGGVGNPGYYDLSPTATLSEAMMRAGGPSQQAKLEDVEYRRAGRNLLEGEELSDRPMETLTLADLGAQRGDQLYVPQGGGRGSFMQVLGIVSGVAGTAFALSRIF